MTRWSAALPQAGINEPSLRRDYGAQRQLVQKFKPDQFLAVRLLLPAHLQPAVVAAVAFMHETDKRIDAGELSIRREALRTWDQQTREAVEHGTSDQPLLRAVADTAKRHPQLRTHITAFLDGAPTEAGWTGFATDSDFQQYVDAYSLPALMLTASLIAPPPGANQEEAFLRGCRTLIEAMQRTDFLADLSEDARQGRIGIPHAELARYGLEVEEVLRRAPRCVPALGQLVADQASAAGAGLRACRELPDLVATETQPFLRACVRVAELELEAVQRKGGKLLHEEAGASKTAALKVLFQQWRATRKQQRRRP
ncbi:squalene/phytoene synthase family protein [Streptomyces sp. NPDC000151]|uniref:squalene/phytoene synthase family protein n=1 Tax=Streptomyces sp. NPDC000151 TaxID=3154244 RepID=UPI00332421A8